MSLELTVDSKLWAAPFFQAFQCFMKVAYAASRSARLGIFRLECSHHINKTLSQCSDHLGTAKNWLKMSAESFLSSIAVRHEKLFAELLVPYFIINIAAFFVGQY